MEPVVVSLVCAGAFAAVCGITAYGRFRRHRANAVSEVWVKEPAVSSKYCTRRRRSKMPRGEPPPTNAQRLRLLPIAPLATKRWRMS